MGLDLFQGSPEAREVFERADQILGRPISKLCFEGPDEELTVTRNAQAAIFVTSLAALRAAQARMPSLKPAMACGLSLGEFTALVALGSVSFEEGLRLVQKRGELMEASCRSHPGSMASLIGLGEEVCRKICTETGAELANLNSPDQIVISGPAEAVAEACRKAEQAGAKRAIRLNVGGAFHSSLMKGAESGLRQALGGVTISPPEGKFIPNVLGREVSEPEEIRSLLARQLTSPVQWIKSMERARELGITHLFEIGPGKVLKGLARRIDPELAVMNMEKQSDIELLKTELETKIYGA